MHQIPWKVGAIWVRLLVVLGLFLAACSAPAAPSPAAPAAKPGAEAPKAETKAAPSGAPLKIGVPVNLTGGLALVGIPVRDGIQLATDDLNAKGGVGGRKVELLIEDTATANDVAVNAVRKILSEKPVALIGLPLSNQVLAAMATLKEAQIPSIVFGTNPTIGPTGKPWVFQIQSNNDVAVSAGVQFLIEKLGKKQVAIIHLNDENGITAMKAAVATLEKNGLKPVTIEAYALGDKDVTGQLVKLRNTNPEAIFSWGDQVGMALVIRQAKQLGISVPMVSGTLVAGTLETLTEAELDGQHIAYRALPALDTDPKIKAFADAYKKRFNRDADEYAAMGYDAVMIIADGVQKGNATPDALTKYIASLKGYEGVCCPHDADENQQLTKSMVVARMKGKIPEPVARVRG